MTTEIQLSRGMVALVDDEDYPILSMRSWYAWESNPKTGPIWYAVRDAYPLGTVRGRAVFVRMHRVILGAKPGEKVDHKDGNGLDNRKHNLRLCTDQQNARNSMKARVPRSSLFKGVSWNKWKKRWSASICLDYKVKLLGMFQEEQDAARAYDNAAMMYFGEFAHPNQTGKAF